jgi:hypothetical protein
MPILRPRSEGDVRCPRSVVPSSSRGSPPCAPARRGRSAGTGRPSPRLSEPVGVEPRRGVLVEVTVLAVRMVLIMGQAGSVTGEAE